MRKSILFAVGIIAIVSCNNPGDKTAPKTDSTATPAVTYAYSIKKPDNWEIGSSSNTAIALNALKAFENNKLDECISFFADSVDWKTDFLDHKFSKDSLKAVFVANWKDMASLKVDMHDFESVISKDNKDEYVTLWYYQTTVDKKGKTDSMAVINDIKITNGKIVSLDEAFRHFPVKK